MPFFLCLCSETEVSDVFGIPKTTSPALTIRGESSKMAHTERTIKADDKRMRAYLSHVAGIESAGNLAVQDRESVKKSGYYLAFRSIFTTFATDFIKLTPRRILGQGGGALE